jgi:V8-like Glu-specific endopeptidase
MRLPATASQIQPQIVNGTPTAAYPSVAAILFYVDTGRTMFDGLCSGTLIGCQSVLTAAHCVCLGDAGDAATCASAGTVDPAAMQIFLQHVGFVDVQSVAIDPSYSFAQAGDLAVITLRQPVTGVAPATLNMAARAAPGTRATIVGFGSTGGPRSAADDAGVNRVGAVTTAGCTNGIPDDTHVCWQFLGSDANTCSGDSGGPLFVDFGGGPLLAGVTSGGETDSCLAPDSDFDTDVFVHRDWIAQQVGSDLGASRCGDLPPVGTEGAHVTILGGTIATGATDLPLAFSVPTGTRLLRVTLDGQLGSGMRSDRVDNDFDLFVRATAPPTDAELDCRSSGLTTFESCELRDPKPGPWFVRVAAFEGVGTVQVTASAFVAPGPACVGDCHNDGEVTIEELLTGVSIALETTPLTACPSFDADGSGAVSVDEIITAVNNTLGACPVS